VHDSVHIDLVCDLMMLSLQASTNLTLRILIDRALSINIRPIFLERNQLVESTIVQEKNFILCQAEILLSYLAILEACLYLATSN